MLVSIFHRFDGFTSTFQDKLFKGYDMEIHNQIFYTTLCSCVLSLTGKNSVYLHVEMIFCFYLYVWFVSVAFYWLITHDRLFSVGFRSYISGTFTASCGICLSPQWLFSWYCITLNRKWSSLKTVLVLIVSNWL